MALAAGTRLGPYEIVSLIGAGGMGDVYRARDTRLDRIVAAKVLRPELAGRSELHQRFEREARVISSLDHPHICMLHDVGHADGLDYLVMEYLEGETLAHRIARGPLPLATVVEIGTQIAVALERAHREKLVHRDLKPSNVMLTRTGAKLMDFGLAKPVTEAVAVGAGSTTTSSPNQTPITAKDTIVGTYQYMAPEVLEGSPADARSDIFSLGGVLYEMITGRFAFSGKNRISVLAAILETEPPPISELQPLTPAALEKVVLGCLAKDPERRWQSAADVAMELGWLMEARPERAGIPSRSRLWWLGFLGVVLAGAVGVLAAFLWRFDKTRAVGALRRYSITLPSSAPLAPSSAMPLGVGRPSIAVSADGEELAYVGISGATTQLFVRAHDGREPRALAGTEGAHSPFFSPDGRWLGFFAEGKLKKVSVETGAIVVLADAVLGFGGDWAADDTIYFTPSEFTSVFAIPASGGTARPVTRFEGRRFLAQSWPQMLPGGKGLLVSNSTAGIMLFDLAAQDLRFLTAGGSYARWSPAGYIVYADNNAFWALPFDLKTLRPTGDPKLIGEQLRIEQQGAAQFALGPDNTLLYARGGDLNEASFVWLDGAGHESDVGLPARRYGEFHVSPDAKSIAVAIRDQDASDLWRYDVDRNTLSRLTHGAGVRSPLWSPDGKSIYYASRKGSDTTLMEISADGTRQRTVAPLTGGYLTSISADGRTIAFRTSDMDQNGRTAVTEVWLVDVGTGEKRMLWSEPYGEGFPSLSPDGRWIAYFSDESGRWDIYVRPMRDLSAKYRVSTAGGEEPIWSPDSRKLYYRFGNTWMQVEIGGGKEFTAGTPHVVLSGPYINIPGYSYDVARDGRFLLLKSDYQDRRITQIEVIENWPQLLKQPQK